MKNKITVFLLVILLIIFQLTVIAVIFPVSANPNLILLFIISLALLFRFSTALLWTIISGLCLDIFSFERVGFSTIMLVIVVYLVSFFKKRFSIENKAGGFLIIIILVSAITFFYRLAIITFEYNLYNVLQIFKNAYFFKNIWKEIIFNLVLFVPIFYLTKKFSSSNAKTIYELAKLKG